jgi:DNA-binding NarL/FixJ family response regulator
VRKNTSTIIAAAGPVQREGIASILQNTPYKVVATAAGPKELTHVLDAERRATLAIVGTDGRPAKLDETAETVRLLRSLMPDGKVVLILETDRIIDLPRVLALSPDSCIVNLGSADTLLKVLELTFINQDVFVLPNSIATTSEDSVESIDSACDLQSPNSHRLGINGQSSLSPREREVLKCLAEGKSNKAIARQYRLSEATIKVHLKAVLRKLGKHNRTQAAIWAIENGVCDSLSEHESIVSDAPSLATGRLRADDNHRSLRMNGASTDVRRLRR